jgi:hypothetical protein
VLSDKTKPIELWVWVVTDDSLFSRRPPPPRIDDIKIRVADLEKPAFDPPMEPSWE